MLHNTYSQSIVYEEVIYVDKSTLQIFKVLFKKTLFLLNFLQMWMTEVSDSQENAKGPWNKMMP